MLTQSELAGLVPEAVVTSELLDATEVNIHRVRADRVKEVTVVADDKHRLLILREVVLQPSHRLKVKVIGRLVEEEVVGFTEEGLCQHHAHLLLVGELAHEFAVEGLL